DVSSATHNRTRETRLLDFIRKFDLVRFGSVTIMSVFVLVVEMAVAALDGSRHGDSAVSLRSSVDSSASVWALIFIVGNGVRNPGHAGRRNYRLSADPVFVYNNRLR